MKCDSTDEEHQWSIDTCVLCGLSRVVDGMLDEAFAAGRAAGLEEAAKMLDAGAVESYEDAEAERQIPGHETLARCFASNASTKRFYATRIRALGAK